MKFFTFCKKILTPFLRDGVARLTHVRLGHVLTQFFAPTPETEFLVTCIVGGPRGGQAVEKSWRSSDRFGLYAGSRVSNSPHRDFIRAASPAKRNRCSRVRSGPRVADSRCNNLV